MRARARERCEGASLGRSHAAAGLGVALLLASAIGLGCGGDSRVQEGSTAVAPGSAGTLRMAERLDSLFETVDPRNNLYESGLRMKALAGARAPADPVGALARDAVLGMEMVKAGMTEEGIAKLVPAWKAMVGGSLGRAPESFRSMVQDFLAVARLRLAEQEACRRRTGRPHCPLTLWEDAGSFEPGSSRAASRAYREILRERPGDLRSRWLLNLASWAEGLPPDSVPSRWRIPPAAFASEYDVGRFPDIAPSLGLDVLGRAGAAVMEDLDGDTDLDILATSRGLRDPIRLFLNDGADGFSEHTGEAGLEGLTGGANLKQADYDNDGRVDVLVLRGGWLRRGYPNSLLKNLGNGRFDDVTEEAGLLSFHPTQTAAWGDYDNDGWLDLFVGNESRGEDRQPCELFHNNGDGTFREVGRAAGIDVVGFVKGVAWGDYDNDGRVDLYVSRLHETNLLFHNAGPTPGGGWRFEEVGRAAGVSEPLDSFSIWFWDYDNDGWLDLFVGGFRGTEADVAAEALGRPVHAEFPRLYHNNADGTFSDVTARTGLRRVLFPMGGSFGDLDNDGWLDFYVGTGDPNLTMQVPNRMFRNDGGRKFQDVTRSGGFGHLGKGHGVAFGDIDQDGDQDIYAVIGGAFEGDVDRNVLFQNPGHSNHWITLRLEGRESNRSAIGARIRVVVATAGGERSVYSTVGSGGSFGANSLQQEIGLGRATRVVELAIDWPGSGRRDVYRDVPLDRILRVREGDPRPRS
ncbi:MAG: CRTAC1 family protein [Gemmatimonadota bacterium]